MLTGQVPPNHSASPMRLFVTADLPPYECADPPLEPLWRALVGEEDLVHIILGDAADRVLPHLDMLPGRKHLVSGVLLVEGGFLLSQVPLHPSQLRPGEINLHGRPLRPLPRDPSRLCVSLGASGFRPVALDQARRLVGGTKPGRALAGVKAAAAE